MQLAIEKLVYGGDGLARLPADPHGRGKTAFVPFVLAGEHIEATLVEQKPGFARGRLEQLLEPSPHRREPPCQYFLRCGGCHYQHSDYAHQLEIKGDILRESLRRTAKLELACELKIHASPEWNYRNRTRLKVQTNPEFALGYYKFRSHELLPVAQCPISSPLIDQSIAAVWRIGSSGQITSSLRELEFFADDDDGALLLEAYCLPGTSKSDALETAKRLRELLPQVHGVAAFEQTAPSQAAEPRKLAEWGETQLTYRTRSGSYRVSAGAFFQVNRFLLDEFAEAVCIGQNGQTALDLYAGVGFFSKVLAGSFAQVIAIEASQTSHADLKQNGAREVKAVLATTEQYLAQVSSELRPDLVVADPPRGGLGENVIQGLTRLNPGRMVYVSCDPATLARDLKMLIAAGYKIERADLFDLFPQTYHIESVFHLAR